MNENLSRLIDLLIIHDGHCSIMVDSPIYTQAVKLVANGIVSFRGCSVASRLFNMIEVNLVNGTEWTNKKFLTALKEKLAMEHET